MLENECILSYVFIDKAYLSIKDIMKRRKSRGFDKPYICYDKIQRIDTVDSQKMKRNGCQ